MGEYQFPESGLRSLFSQTLMMKWLTQSVPTTVRTCVIYSQCSRCHLDLVSLVEPPTLEVSLSLLRLTQPQPMISSMRSSLMLNTWVPWQLVLSHAPTQILMALVMSRMLVEMKAHQTTQAQGGTGISPSLSPCSNGLTPRLYRTAASVDYNSKMDSRLSSPC